MGGGMPIKILCDVCGKTSSRSRSWRTSDGYINLPDPPDDLIGTKICGTCYTDGPTMEQRIRNRRLTIAAAAQGVYAYKPASTSNAKPSGWNAIIDDVIQDWSHEKRHSQISRGPRKVSFPDLPRVQMPDGSDGLICLGCQTYSPWVVSNCTEGFKCCNCKD